MNHVNDIAHKIADYLGMDAALYSVGVKQGAPDAERSDYPNRDGEWLVYLVDMDGRAFKATVTPVDQIEAYTVIDASR